MAINAIDVRNVQTLEQARTIITAFQNELARQVTQSNNRDSAFDIMLNKWTGTVTDLRTYVVSQHDNGHLTDEQFGQIVATLDNDLTSSMMQVKNLGLADLHDALAPPPVSGLTPAAMGASLTVPVSPNSVGLNDDGTVTVNGNPVVPQSPSTQDFNANDEQPVSSTPEAPTPSA